MQAKTFLIGFNNALFIGREMETTITMNFMKSKRKVMTEDCTGCNQELDECCCGYCERCHHTHEVWKHPLYHIRINPPLCEELK